MLDALLLFGLFLFVFPPGSAIVLSLAAYLVVQMVVARLKP